MNMQAITSNIPNRHPLYFLLQIGEVLGQVYVQYVLCPAYGLPLVSLKLRLAITVLPCFGNRLPLRRIGIPRVCKEIVLSIGSRGKKMRGILVLTFQKVIGQPQQTWPACKFRNVSVYFYVFIYSFYIFS